MATVRPGENAYTGILLAAGRGRRYDPLGQRNKLMQPLAAGEPVALAAAKRLLTVLPQVVAVVRPDSGLLEQRLREAGCRVTVCDAADEGMAASLVHGLRTAIQAPGWVIALGDMPWVDPATIAALVDAVDAGAQIAVPTHGGRRGNPVAFSRGYLPELLALRGDTGARGLLARWPVTEVPVSDTGIFRDVDTQDDLGSDAAS